MSRSRRIRVFVAALAATASVVMLSVAYAPSALAEVPPTLTAPFRVYPTENTTLDFGSGKDPISGDTLKITAAGTNEGDPSKGDPDCNDAPGNKYDTDDCPRIQMDLEGGEPGLLSIPGNSVVQVDGAPVIVNSTGAVVTNASDSDGGPSELFDFNGTETQLNDTLAKLQFIPATNYREKDLDQDSLPFIKIVVVNGDDAMQSESDVQIKVEGPNTAPTITTPANPITVSTGQNDTAITGQADVTDPEICNLNLCGSPFPNQGIADPDSSMLLTAWFSESNCGTFNFGGAQFPYIGGATNSTVDTLLKNAILDENDDKGYVNADARAAIEASLNPAALTLDLSQQPSSTSADTAVFAGVGTIDILRDALEDIEYTTPATAMTCHLNVSVSDLGNLGTPASFNETANPPYEVPIAKGANGQITFNVMDTHPHVTVEQSAPGIPGVDPTHTDANFTVTFDQAVSSFDGTDIDTSKSTATGTTCEVIPVTPGTVYSVSCIAPQDGKITVQVDAGVVYASGHDGDAAFANAASTSSDNTVTWDATAPTETIDASQGQALATSASPILYTIVFSEKTTAALTLTGSDIDLSTSTAGGTLVATVSQPSLTDLNTFQVSVTGMTTAGNVIATVKPNVVTDQALNFNKASTSTDNDNTVAWTPSAVGPTVTINKAAGQADPTSTSPIKYTVTFSSPVTGFDATDVVLNTSTAGGTLVPTLEAGGGPTVWTVDVTGMTTAGNVVASIPANAATDSTTSQANSASTSTDNSVAWTVADTTPPSVTINAASGQALSTSTSPIKYTVTFSEAVTGFDATDVKLNTSTAGGPVPTLEAGGGPSVWTVDVTGMTTSGNVTATIPAGAAIDAASNASLASTSTSNTVAWVSVADTTPPSVTINAASGQALSTSTSPIKYTVTFSEPVSGFDQSDIVLNTSTAGGTLVPTLEAGGGPSVWTVDVTGMTTSGNVTATIPAGAAIDAASNASLASTSTSNTVAWVSVADTTPPSVTINAASGQALSTATSPIKYTVTFSEPVSGFDQSDIVLSTSTAGGTLVPTLEAGGGPSVWTVDVTGMTTSGNVTATIPAGAAIDAASNASLASTSTSNTVAWVSVADTTPPSVTINAASGQALSTSTSPIKYTVTFSEPVSGFDQSDIVLSTSTAGGTLVPTLEAGGGPSVWTVDVTGMTTSGNVTATIPAGAAIDAASNASLASTSTSNTVAWVSVADTTPPSVTINKAAGQADPTSTSPIKYTVTFSEPVSGFDQSDIVLSTSTAGGTLVPTLEAGGGPSVWTVDVTGMTTSGNVTATIPAGAAIDAASNASLASTSTDDTVAWTKPVASTPPSVTINQANNQTDPTSASPIHFTVTFSASVTGFAASDVILGGSAHANHVVVSGSGADYSVAVSGMTATGTVWAVVPAGAAKNSANDASKASTSVDNTVHYTKPDTTKPTVTINQASGQADPDKSASIKFTAVFSETVIGFATGDVTLGGTAHATHAVVSGSGHSYTITVTGMTNGGTVWAVIAAGKATDAAHNPNVASTSTDNTVTYNPTVTIVSNGHHITLSVTNGVLTQFKTVHPNVPAPQGATFEWGVWTFTATSQPGAVVTFTLTLPSHPSGYDKLVKGKWQAFTWDGTTGAQIHGDVITIKIRDNGRGDSDSKSGVVMDPGAGGAPADGGATGGGTLAVTGVDALGLGGLALLLIVGGGLSLALGRRRGGRQL